MTHVVIPVRDQWALTASICAQLSDQDGWKRCLILDNGSRDETRGYLARLAERDRRFVRLEASGRGIYECWDMGLRNAQAHGADTITFLNNDIVLAPDTLRLLAEALRAEEDLGLVYPNYDRRVAEGVVEGDLRTTTGTYRHGGMSGWSFMVRAAAIDWAPLVNPTLRWWGGDDDIAFKLEERGWRQVRLEGLPVDHLGAGTARHHGDELDMQKAEDLANVLAIWGR